MSLMISWTSTLEIGRLFWSALTDLLKTDLLVLRLRLVERSLKSSDFGNLRDLPRPAYSTLLVTVFDREIKTLVLFVLEVNDSRRIWLLGLLVLLAGPFLRLQRSILLHELTSDRSLGFAKDVLAAKQVAAKKISNVKNFARFFLAKKKFCLLPPNWVSKKIILKNFRLLPLKG